MIGVSLNSFINSNTTILLGGDLLLFFHLYILIKLFNNRYACESTGAAGRIVKDE